MREMGFGLGRGGVGWGGGQLDLEDEEALSRLLEQKVGGRRVEVRGGHLAEVLEQKVRGAYTIVICHESLQACHRDCT